MRFMMIVKANQQSEAGVPPDPRLMEAVGKLGEEAVRAGTMVASGGLAPSAMGTRIRIGGGPMKVIDGPFAEAKELIAGYSIIEAASLAEVIELVKQWPSSDARRSVRPTVPTATRRHEAR